MRVPPRHTEEPHIAASGRMIIVAFRGTQSQAICDWLSDANGLLTSIPASARLL
ncbi:hypothetical protein [Nonomuraea sp. NPDC050202]|uniref:hypothetical protein n=1 Tax=Nonomuraea sp. NPDC050202 TaxID=3155035 RepID=UPI0033CFEDDC